MAAQGASERGSEPAPSVWAGLARALSPIEERPRIAVAVEGARFTTKDGAPYVVAHNPVAHTYLRLDPAEYDLLPLMDGSRSLKALTIEYYQRHGVLAFPRIAGLVRLLHEHQFLANPPVDTYVLVRTRLRGHTAEAWLQRLGRGFLQSELALKGLDPALGRAYERWGHYFFSRPAVLVGTVLGVLGPLLFYLELTRGRYALFQAGGSYIGGFLLLFLVSALALLAHEMGHGLAVKHAGRTVHQAGLMIYYGYPAAFVDTTDVWMAPRRMRLLTSFAGPWTGLVLGGGCALLTVLLPEGPVGEFLFAWGFVFLLTNLLNFNPLLELDGYYLLVDLLEKPMLRARALAFVRGPLWRKLWERQRLEGEERFFAWFGGAAAVWSVLSILLAIRFWEIRIVPMVEEAWTGGGLLERVGLGLIGVLIGVPLVLALWGLVKRVAGWFVVRANWLTSGLTARRHREALAALRSVPLWAETPEPVLLDVAQHLRAEHVPAGTEVVRQGEPGDRFYVIARGTFEVVIDGRPVTQLGRGDYFGERALLNDAPRAATVVATESGQVYSLDQAGFRQLLAHDLETRARLETRMELRADIAAMPLLRDLSPSQLDLVLTRLEPLRVEAGETIIRQGEPGDQFYMLRAGSVSVEQDGEMLAELGPGEAFGEIALLMDVPRTATVRAKEPTDLLALSAPDFRDLLARYCARAGELERLSHLRLSSHRRLDQVGSG